MIPMCHAMSRKLDKLTVLRKYHIMSISVAHFAIRVTYFGFHLDQDSDLIVGSGC